MPQFTARRTPAIGTGALKNLTLKVATGNPEDVVITYGTFPAFPAL